tara:strand:- start:1954 stop:2685 length:732 start_codon:yes stop_codon:yes gene_type:complete
MATINIGSLTFTHKGDYASGTAYVKNDVVYYSTNGNAYIAKTSTTGNAPTSTSHWDLFAAGSGGIWNAGLSLGSAGQAVKVNSAGNALEFGTISTKVKGMKSLFYSGNTTVSSDGSGDTRDHANIMGGTLTYTPQSTSSKIFTTLTSGIGGFADKNVGGFGLSLSISQSGGINFSNAHASQYGFYDLGNTAMSYGDASCISRMDSNSSTNQITVTGQGYWYDETPNGSVQFRSPCLTVFEFEE